MAGIYIHIPFCKRRCTYCDFYTEVAPEFLPKLIDCIVKEISIRKDYLNNAPINTIYFGGGTPSLLSKDQFQKIFDAIYSNYTVNDNAEVTLEANPDDLTTGFFRSIQELPFNRLSIGIQSFDNKSLKQLNRRHTAEQAVSAVKNAQNAGFKNISIDLIYGLPSQSVLNWEKQIDTALSLQIQHISAYGLTYEEGTVLWNQREKGLLNVVEDDTMNEMYLLLVNKLKQNGFDAYEISNFAKDDFKSRHNSAYWRQEPYIGLGPSAHSYNLYSRQWNIASIYSYTNAIDSNSAFYETEQLTTTDKFNDYIMVSLRTSEGIDLDLIKQEFSSELAAYCVENIKPFIDTKKVDFSNNKLRLSTEGILISNHILIQLMKV